MLVVEKKHKNLFPNGYCVSDHIYKKAQEQKGDIRLKVSKGCFIHFSVDELEVIDSVIIIATDNVYEMDNGCRNHLIGSGELFEVPKSDWEDTKNYITFNPDMRLGKEKYFLKSYFKYIGDSSSVEATIVDQFIIGWKPITQQTSITSGMDVSQKGTQAMGMIDVGFLKTLARTSEKDEYSASAIPEGPFKAAMETAKAKRKEAEEAKLGEQMLNILECMENLKQANVHSIRDHRAKISKLKNQLEEMDRAMAYANETQNFLPLCKLLGLTNSTGTEYEIPKDWNPAK